MPVCQSCSLCKCTCNNDQRKTKPNVDCDKTVYCSILSFLQHPHLSTHNIHTNSILCLQTLCYNLQIGSGTSLKSRPTIIQYHSKKNVPLHELSWFGEMAFGKKLALPHLRMRATIALWQKTKARNLLQKRQ
jgi:hypothetical protein